MSNKLAKEHLRSLYILFIICLILNVVFRIYPDYKYNLICGFMYFEELIARKRPTLMTLH